LDEGHGNQYHETWGPFGVGFVKILVLGAGKMVEAILSGLSGKVDLSSWGIFSPSGVRAKNLSEKYGLQWVEQLYSVSEDRFTWTMVGCKPQQLEDLSKLLTPSLRNLPCISMLAALEEELQIKTLGINQLVRIMPNLPVQFGSGVTLISSASLQESLAQVKKLFSHLGHIEEVTESELEELTLLTGSGPALIYEFVKILSQSFYSLNPLQREKLARLMLSGAARTCNEKHENLEHLISAVTSKGGVTIAVLEKWREEQLSQIINSGIENGKLRSREITQALKVSTGPGK
jgi:pyrroline-5-carboxylate reductase